jgi:hypothetical protein
MRTKLTIMAIILVLDLVAVAVGVLLVLTLGGPRVRAVEPNRYLLAGDAGAAEPASGTRGS